MRSRVWGESSSEIGTDDEAQCHTYDSEEKSRIDVDGISPIAMDEEEELACETPARSTFISSNNIVIEEYQGAALTFAKGDNLYSQIWKSDEYYGSRKTGGPHYPFSGPTEWEMVQWLHSLNAPMEKIDQFFNLRYVSPKLEQL